MAQIEKRYLLFLSQKGLQVGNASGSVFSLLFGGFPECSKHELALSLLDIQDSFLDAVFHDQAPHRGLTLLTETVHSIYRLIFNGRCLPTVCENGLVGGNKVQTDATDAQTGEQDGAFGVGGEAGCGVVAREGVHLAVDTREADPVALEVGLHQI